MINGVETKIRENLVVALRSLAKERLFEGKFRLWVDALCINQADNTERSQQVLKMKEIYGMAWSVTVWLGEAVDNSGKAFNLVEKLSKINGKESAEAFERTFKRNPTYREQGSWLATQRLLYRPYWKRLWVI